MPLEREERESDCAQLLCGFNGKGSRGGNCAATAPWPRIAHEQRTCRPQIIKHNIPNFKKTVLFSPTQQTVLELR